MAEQKANNQHIERPVDDARHLRAVERESPERTKPISAPRSLLGSGTDHLSPVSNLKTKAQQLL